LLAPQDVVDLIAVILLRKNAALVVKWVVDYARVPAL
jgi:hypothetical protein